MSNTSSSVSVVVLDPVDCRTWLPEGVPAAMLLEICSFSEVGLNCTAKRGPISSAFSSALDLYDVGFLQLGHG